MGFGIPLGEWLRGPLRDWAETLLSEQRLREGGLLDAAHVRRHWTEHLSGHRNWQYLLWDVSDARSLARALGNAMTRPVVLHVIPSLVMGGAEHVLTSLVTAKRLTPYPQGVVNLMKGGPYTDPIRNAGVPLYEIGLNRANLPVAVFRLASLIRKLSPLVIQSWLYYGDLIATVALYLSGRRHQTRLYWGALFRHQPALQHTIAFSCCRTCQVIAISGCGGRELL